MIGLKRNTLRVVEHDPAWAMLAFEACQAVRNACGELLADVQHVGSTAVPELPAKPILDLAAAAVTIESMVQIAGRLASIGYCDRGDRGDAGGHLFVLDSSPGVRTIHLHVVQRGSSQWRDYLRFRDLLRHSPALRKRYEELKRNLADVCRDDREAYTASKAGFIKDALQSRLNRRGDSDNQRPA